MEKVYLMIHITNQSLLGTLRTSFFPFWNSERQNISVLLLVLTCGEEDHGDCTERKDPG